MCLLAVGATYVVGILGSIAMTIVGKFREDENLLKSGIVVFSLLVGLPCIALFVAACVVIGGYCYCGAYGQDVIDVDERFTCTMTEDEQNEIQPATRVKMTATRARTI